MFSLNSVKHKNHNPLKISPCQTRLSINLHFSVVCSQAKVVIVFFSLLTCKKNVLIKIFCWLWPVTLYIMYGVKAKSVYMTLLQLTFLLIGEKTEKNHLMRSSKCFCQISEVFPKFRSFDDQFFNYIFSKAISKTIPRVIEQCKHFH